MVKDIFKYVLEECVFLSFEESNDLVEFEMLDEDSIKYIITISKKVYNNGLENGNRIRIRQQYHVVMFNDTVLLKEFEYCDMICNPIVYELVVALLNDNNCFVLS